MRWFKHFTNARHNPKFRAIEKKLGEAGYARVCKLLEIIGERGGSGKDFAPRLDLNEPYTDLGWLADEMEIDPRSAKVTLAHFAKCKFIDPQAYQGNIIYVPQMIEYLDEWTRKRQPRDSVATPESLRSNSPQSKSQSQKSELEVDKEVEGDDKSKSDDPPPDQKLTSSKSFSSSEKPDLSQKRDLTGDQTGPDSTPPARVSQYDPWIFLGIDRGRVPKRFRMDSDDDSDAPNFETRFKMWWQKYRLNCKEMGEDPIPEEFAEHVLENCEDEEVEYPPILLKRKKELSAA
jgi:hypothetical protein